MVDNLPMCMRCKKPVDGLVVDKIPFSDIMIWTVYCHGETQEVVCDGQVDYVFNVNNFNAGNLKVN